MIRSRFVRSSILVLSTFVAISCSDHSPTEPVVAPTAAVSAPAQGQDALLGGLLGGVVGVVGALVKVVVSVVGFVADASNLPAHPIAWNASYSHVSHTVSGTITPRGGTLSIPESDFTLNFPLGAVSSPTLITITSDPNYVSYQMQPAGTNFAQPLVATQGLAHTSLAGKSFSGKLFGGYISDDLIDLSTLLHVLEIEFSTTVYVPGSTTIPQVTGWTINHFSRYMLASD